MSKTRVMAIVASAFWLIFTVSLILYFVDPKNVVFSILTLSSGIVGAILYFVVRFMQKESTYGLPVDDESSGEPNEEQPSDDEASEEPSAEQPSDDESQKDGNLEA